MGDIPKGEFRFLCEKNLSGWYNMKLYTSVCPFPLSVSAIIKCLFPVLLNRLIPNEVPCH